MMRGALRQKLFCGLTLLGLGWGFPSQIKAVDQLPIRIVYINHVEVESVLDYTLPLVDGTTYSTTAANYAYVSNQIEWEVAQAESVNARISFHMSGAYAEQAVAAGGQALWVQHLLDGHTVGIHYHSFLRGPAPFQWIRQLSPTQPEIAQAWQDNYDLAASLAGAQALWVGESHYSCPSCWQALGYRLKSTERLALLPTGQHIVWLVVRSPQDNTITYPHFPQIGQASTHPGTGLFFDLRLPQLKKEFLMLYLEWLERERLDLAPQVWAWGWMNHGGSNTQTYAAEIQEIFAWMADNFVGRASPRGNIIAEFVSDHQLSDIYEAYEASGGQPLPSPVSNVNDLFPYMADALADAGVTADLTADLGLTGVRLFELERDPSENPLPPPLPRVYLLFRETDASGPVDISSVLASRGITTTGLTLLDVTDGTTSSVQSTGLVLDSVPLVLEPVAEPPSGGGEVVLSGIVELTLGSDLEARPEIFFQDGRFFVVHLAVDPPNMHKVRVYDSDLSTVLAEYTISAYSSSYGSPTDIRGRQEGGVVYLAYQTADTVNQQAHLFVTVNNLDAAFSEIVSSGSPVATGALWGTGSPGDEYLNDPAVYLKNGWLHLFTHIRTGVQPSDDTIYRMRTLDPMDLQVTAIDDLYLGDLLDGPGDLSTFFEKEGTTYGIFPNIIDLGVTHSLRLLAFDSQFTPDPASARDLADVGINLHPTGWLRWNGRYYLAHSNNDTAVSGPEEPQREVWLKCFDEDFNLLQEIMLEDRGIHPTLTTDGERLYLAYSSFQKLRVAVFDRVPETTERSPFGFLPASVALPGYPDNGFVDAEYIGVRWHRAPVPAYWFLIQPDLNNPTYDWAIPDGQYGTAPVGINILANIAPEPPGSAQGYTQPGTYIPIDILKYEEFVRATVERYDGDGLNDMPGLSNPVKHWQVGNEPNKYNNSNFAVLQQITYQAIKDACPDCTVLIGGVAGSPDNYIADFDSDYAPILAQLAGQYVDVFDFHWYGTASGEYRLTDTVTGQDVYDYVRANLIANGFPPNLPIWITEMGSYSGDPVEPQFPLQTERQQAGDYFKRFMYSLSRGVEKIFPAFGLMEGFGLSADGYFDHTGLIYDGADSGDLGLGVKKLGYYTYKKMTEKLDGADWSTVAILRDGTDTDWLYLVGVVKNGQPVNIAWWDYFDESGYTPGDTKDITLTGLLGDVAIVTTVVPFANLGQDVTDYNTAFTVTPYSIAAGQVAVPLAENPVIIETRISGDFDGNGTVDPSNLDTFIEVLLGSNTDPVDVALADMNGDGAADGKDIQPFVNAILGL